MKKVVLPCSVVTCLSIPIPFFLKGYGTSVIDSILLVFVTIGITCLIMLLAGLDKSEKSFLKSMSNKILKKN